MADLFQNPQQDTQAAPTIGGQMPNSLAMALMGKMPGYSSGSSSMGGSALPLLSMLAMEKHLKNNSDAAAELGSSSGFDPTQDFYPAGSAAGSSSFGNSLLNGLQSLFSSSAAT